MTSSWIGRRPIVGQTADRSRLVSAGDIELFTAMSGDRNPIHYDPVVAERTALGGIVVQGGVGSAILNAVVAEELPGPGSVFLQLDLRFVAPVRPGDVITGTVEVTSVRDDKPITGLDVRVTRDDGVLAIHGSAVCYTFPITDTAGPLTDTAGPITDTAGPVTDTAGPVTDTAGDAGLQRG